MTTTPMIQKLVREGRVTPRDAALLVELRSRVKAKRDSDKLRRMPVIGVAVFALFFVLSFLGIRREA